MRSRVYETVASPSVCLSVCAIDRRAASLRLLLSAPRAGDIDQQLLAPGAQQQRSRNTAHYSNCGQGHVDSRRTWLAGFLHGTQAL